MPGLSPEQWQALSPQLDKALEMSDDERATWLASLRIEDPSLSDSLQQLLQEHKALANDRFLDDQVVPLPERTGLAGQSIGAYTLISQIGRGGMGTVWLAERSDGRFERKVAVKFLNIALLGKTGEERFRREGMILGRLAHPHIAELIDAGVSRTAQPYLVLEHVEGDHVDTYCDRLGLDIPARIRLFLDVLAAVEHAHANLIVHRDLKPSNVLVRNDGEVKLLDFGIAKLIESEPGDEETQLTLEGGRALTPEFAAPEQLTGQPITTVTDVYALGVLLYVLLTGEHPTAARTHAPADVIKAVLDTDPLRPSDAVSRTSGREELARTHASSRSSTPERLGRILRGDLDTIVTTAVKKNPRERYSSVKDFADDLRRYLKNEPISARPDALTYRAGKFARRHRGAVFASLLIALILVAASITTWFFSHRAVPLPQIKQLRLTANPPDLPVLNSAISPDGTYLGYADQQGIHVVQADGGGSQLLTLPPELRDDRSLRVFGGWFPDSKHFLASAALPGSPATLWSVSLAGNEPTKIAEVIDLFGPVKVSPDGKTFAYTRVNRTAGAGEMWLMSSNGESSRLIKTADPQSSFANVGWSPSGNRLVYINREHRADRPDISVRSCDLQGRNVTTIVHELRLDGFAWTAPGRFIYSRTSDPGGTDSDNLLELSVNENGVPEGAAKRLTDWSGFFATDFTSSGDGKHLAFRRGNSHIDIFVGDFAGREQAIANLHPLPIDDNYNIPLTWTLDSRELLFSSKHAENRLIYRQSIDEKTPARLITDSVGMSFYIARPAPDGSAMILEGSPGGRFESGLYRAELSGGSPRLLFKTNEFVLYSCTNKLANFCVLGEMNPGTNELVITRFDPQEGHRNELLRIPLEPGTSARIGDDYSWQIAPDGSQIAVLKRHDAGVRLIPLNGNPARTIQLKAHTDVFELNWASDSKGLLISSLAPAGAAVLQVDLGGNVRQLWQQRQAHWVGALQSPDGRRIITYSVIDAANVWMIDNF